jgi:hypothetical protein
MSLRRDPNFNQLDLSRTDHWIVEVSQIALSIDSEHRGLHPEPSVEPTTTRSINRHIQHRRQRVA